MVYTYLHWFYNIKTHFVKFVVLINVLLIYSCLSVIFEAMSFCCLSQKKIFLFCDYCNSGSVLLWPMFYFSNQHSYLDYSYISCIFLTF